MMTSTDFAPFDTEKAEVWGIIPLFITSASEKSLPQIEDNYGKTHEIKTLTLHDMGNHYMLKSKFADESDLKELDRITNGTETLVMFNYSIVAIIQQDGSSYVTRLD